MQHQHNHRHQQPNKYCPSPLANQPPGLPLGWEQAQCPNTGRPYYANRSTGETLWEKPIVYFPPPPPPRPDMLHQSMQQETTAPHQRLTEPAVQSLPADYMVMQSNNYDYNNNIQQYPQTQPQQSSVHYDNNIPSSSVQSIPSESHNNIPTQQQIVAEPQQPRMHGNIPSEWSGLGPSTIITPGMLVPSIRRMIDEEYTQRYVNNNKQSPSSTAVAALPKLELEGLSAGAIADLCNVTRELNARNVDGGDFAGMQQQQEQRQQGDEEEEDVEEVDQYYAPLQPFALPVSSISPHIEPGRVDIRLHALHTKLGKI